MHADDQRRTMASAPNGRSEYLAGDSAMPMALGKRPIVKPARFEVDHDDEMPATGKRSLTRKSAVAYHATKNLRISAARVSALARKHFQSGRIAKPLLKKKKPKMSRKRGVVAEWPAIKGATLSMTKAKHYYIVAKDRAKYPLAQTWTRRTKTGAPKEGALKLKEKLGAEGNLKCTVCTKVFGARMCNTKGIEIARIGVSSFQLDHIDPKRPSMSQGRSYEAYLDAYEKGHLAIKCYECIGLQYNLQGMEHVGNSRNYTA